MQHHFNCHRLSVVAGIPFRRFYVRLLPWVIKGAQIIEFWHVVGQQIRQPRWSSGTDCRRNARLAREYLEALNGAIQN